MGTKTKRKAELFAESGQTVPVLKVDSEALFLRQAIAEGEVNGRTFDLTLNMSTGELFVEFASPRAVYAVRPSDIIKAAAIAEAA